MIVVIVYISTILYTTLLSAEIYNCYQYLYLKKKYTVFPVTLFYALSIPLTASRIYENSFVVEICSYYQVWFIIMPIALKVGVGLSQVLVMVEIAILVGLSMQPHRKKKYNILIKCLRAIVVLMTLFLAISWSIICITAPKTASEG